eukprot:scaffold647921_cov50-Prasinocladus_malaysianus.AAC.1
MERGDESFLKPIGLDAAKALRRCMSRSKEKTLMYIARYRPSKGLVPFLEGIDPKVIVPWLGALQCIRWSLITVHQCALPARPAWLHAKCLSPHSLILLYGRLVPQLLGRYTIHVYGDVDAPRVKARALAVARSRKLPVVFHRQVRLAICCKIFDVRQQYC